MITPEEFEELYKLLPFYANGTLSDEDRGRLDAALAQSTQLRAALEEEQAIRQQLVTGIDGAIQQSAEQTAAREAVLKARVSVSDRMPSPADGTRSHSSLGKALALLNPRNWHPAVAFSLALALPAQAAVIASQASQIAWLEDENFRLASGPCDEKPDKGSLLIEVKDEARFDALMQLLAQEKLTIVESGDLGTLTVKTGLEGEALGAQLDRLRASPLVSSADPAA